MTPPTRRPRRAASTAAPALLLAALALAPASCTDRPRPDATIEFWTLSLTPTFTGFIESQVAEFQAANPGVRVEWVDVPFGAVERKLIAAAAAGRAPDVVNLSDLMFARYAAAGAFTDLTALLPGDPADRYHDGALGVGRLGGELQALPWYITTQALIVNEDVLARGGLAPEDLPEDWLALARLAPRFREATEAAGEPAYLFTQPLGEESQLPIMLMADGRPPFREGPRGLLQPDLTRADVVDFVRTFVDLYRDGHMPREAATRGFEHLIDVYPDRRVAALNTGANFLRRVRGVNRDVYDRTVVLPPLTGSLDRAHVAVMPVAVSASSEHPRLAAELAWFITGPESQLEFCRLATILPSTPAALADPFFAGPTEAETEEGVARIGAARALVARELPTAVAFTPAVEAWPDMRTAFNAGMKSAMLDGVPVETALANVNREWAELIDEMNERRAAAGAPPAMFSAVPTPPPAAGPGSPTAAAPGSAPGMHPAPANAAGARP